MKVEVPIDGENPCEDNQAVPYVAPASQDQQEVVFNFLKI